MATRTISASGGTRAYSDTATWDEGAVPTSSDDVVARGDGTSGAVTISGSAACRSADFTNYSNTLTHNLGVTWTIGTSSAPGSNVALFMPLAMTYTLGNATSSAITFSTTQASQTVTTNGKALGNLALNAAGGVVLQDALTCGVVTITAGTFNSNGKTVTSRSCVLSGATAKTLTLGASTWNVATGTGSGWSMGGSNNTISAASSTINVSCLTGFFTAGGVTYGTVRLTGTGVASVTASFTCTTFERSNAAAVTVQLTAGITITATTLILSGTSGNLVTLNTTSAGSAATISVAAGSVIVSFMSIKDSTVSGGATFRAEQSTNVSGNTGWTFGPLFVGSTAGVSGVPNAALPVSHPLAGSTAGTSTTSADINWASKGQGGIGG